MLDNPENFQKIANDLLGKLESKDYETLHDEVKEIKDQLEIVLSSGYSQFLTALLPGFKTILGKIEPQFLDSQEQKIRQMVIEIMQRLPTKEILKPHSAMIMNTCLEIITKDNQENAILATKIAIDLHRALRNMPDKVQPLMEIILDMYRSFPDLVKRCEEEAKDKRNTESISAGSPLEKQDQSRMLQIKGTESFKVICEFPLLLVILQQVYPNEVDQFKAELIKVTEKALLISPSEFTNLKSTKLSSKFRHRYTDLILVLVKTVSFWAYMVRSPKTAGMLENQKNRIPEVILKLLLDCPTESISARKELLVILSRLTNAKCTHEFVGHIDKLLDDEVLLGTSRTSRESLRPFAYNTMVELIDTIKSDLSPEQIEKIIDFYVCALNDLTLSMYVQHQSAKLLVRLLEKIHAMGNETPFIERKNLLLKILKAFVTKTKTLSSMIQKAVHKSLEEKNQDSNSSQEVQPMQIDEDMLKDSKSSTDSSEEPESNSYSLGTDLKPSMVKDCRSIFHTLVCGMRNCILVLFRIRKEANTSAGNISSDEIALYISSLKHGIDCFPVLTMRQDNGVVLQDKKKEQLDTFASQFVMLPPDVFKEIFNRQLEHLYEKILEDQTNLPFPTVLLSNDHVAAYFSDMLLNFLTARMDRMQGLTNESNMLLRLFKLVFGSIVTFCNHENVLNKHLNKIVNSCLEYSSQNKESTNYFLTLRALFRSIVSGKLDLVREDFGRLVNKVLDKLTSLLKVCTKSPLRDLLIELCLTIPVKLNVLCPHLGKLTRPLLCALNGGPDLAVLGLKHLESWVDSLKTDVLEPFLKPIMPELLIALFSHLRPPGPQHQHGVLAMRILAKLGGHNRKYFSQSSCVEIHKNPEEGMQVLINFNTGNETKKKGLKLSLDHFIRTAAQSILTSPDENCRRYAYSLCRSCLIALLDLQGNAKQDFKISDDYKGFELTKTIFTVQSSNNFFDPYTVEDKSRAPKTQTRVRAESSLFKKLVFTMFAACADGKLKEEAKPFAKWFCQHYMLVILGNTKPPHGQLELNPDIVVDALVEVFCSENIENFMPVGEEYLVGMISMSKQLLGTVERASHLRLWDKFAYRFCHSCAKVQWFKKLGGCRGILTLANNLSPFWVITREVEFVKGLIFILKESNLGAMSTMVEEGRSALRRIITICHTPENMKQAERQVENLQLTASGHNIIQRKFLEIRTSFVQELSSAHESVRETVQSILQLLSDLMGKSITELLKQDFQANLSNTVTAKRFDALGLSLQTGFCEAVRFFISLDPPLLPLNPQIMDIISIALKMTEHPKEARTAREFDPKVQANLQLSCVRLLCAALNNPDMQQNEQKFEHARQAIIERFFALLQSDNEKIVFAVKQGLSTYISQQHLKKELLQSCLRPILSTLGHHQYLKISVLSTLKHLLELCTNYFNVKLGEQLLAHLRTWKTKEQIVGDDDPVERGAKLLELFSFLPQDCKQLLDSLVPLTHDLEAEWKIEYSNVFREPLARYLKQYPEATINYFFSPSPQGKEPISESHNFSLFLSVISFDFASPIAEHIASNYEDFLKKMCLHDYSLGNEPVQHYIHDFEMQFKGLVILKKLAKLQPQWMASTTIVDSLRKLWLNPQLRQVELENRHSLSFDLLKKYRTILKCFMNIYQHCKDMSTKVDILYLTLHALTDNYLASDSYFLKDFYDRHIVKNYDTEQKEAILSRFVEQFESSEETQEYKVKALQNLIFPGLSAAFERNQENVLNRKLVGSVVETLFSGQNNNIEESLRVELLQLATLFVTYIPDVIFVDRKHIIRFAYNHIRNQDTTSKQCASVLAARFIKAYDTPHKITLQVYVALLRAYQPEGQELVRKALDTLTPALPKRLPREDHRHPKWISWTKKVIFDDGHSTAQLLHIWQLFVRCPSLFYPYRALFVSQIVNSLGKIGMPLQAGLDYRKLCLELVDLVISWEQQSRKEIETSGKTLEDKADNENVKKEEIDEDNESKEFTLSRSTAEIVVNYLICATMPTHFGDNRNVNTRQMQARIINKSIELLKQAFNLWPDIRIKFSNLEKVIQYNNSQFRDDTAPSAIEVLFLLLDHEATSKVFLQNNHMDIILAQGILPLLSKKAQKPEEADLALPSSPREENKQISESMTKFLGKLFQIFPLNSMEDVSTEGIDKIRGFYNALQDNVYSALEKCISSPEPTPFTLLSVFKILCESSPNPFHESHVDVIAKLSTKMLKEHAVHTNQLIEDAKSKSPHNVSTSQRPHITQKKILSAIASNNKYLDCIQLSLRFLASIHTLSNMPQWRVFLSSLVTIFEKPEGFNREIVTTAFDLLLEKFTKSEINDKEKSGFLQRIMPLERYPDETVKHKYYDFVHTLYTHPDSHNSSAPDLKAKIESCFMSGLRSEKSEIRNKFLDVINNNLGNTIEERFEYVLQSNRWEPLSDQFWIKHALDLLLETIEQDQPLELIELTSRLYNPFKRGHSPMLRGSPNTTTPLHSDEQAQLEQIDNSILFEEYESYKQQIINVHGKDIIIPLRELARESIRFSYNLWIAVFPIVWAQFTTSEQDTLQEMLLELLACDYHGKQYIKYPNVVQALLESITKCSNKIEVSPEMVKFMGKSFKAWHIVLPLLEQELLEHITNGAIGDNTERVCLSLCELYRVLSEEDMLLGVMRTYGISTETKKVLAIEQREHWTMAQDTLRELVSSFHKGESLRSQVTHAELCLWGEHWLNSARNLQQWDEIKRYAEATNSGSMLLECFWKKGDWVSMKEALAKHSVSQNKMLKIYQISLATMESSPKDLQDAIEIFHHASQISLQRWRALPTFQTTAHISMLHNFQQLIELNESARFLREMGRITSAELKAFFSTWRDRIPNKWDDLSIWTDILTWRRHFFERAAEHSNNSTMCSMEAVWATHKLAGIFRKNRLLGVSRNLLEDACKLIKEDENHQALEITLAQKSIDLLKCDLKDQTRHRGTLETVTKLEKSKQLSRRPEWKIELLRIKGDIERMLNNKQDAYTSYSHALDKPQDMNPSVATCVARSWAHWAQLCNEIIDQDETWRAHAVTCFLQSVRFNVRNARPNIAQVVHLVKSEVNSSQQNSAIQALLTQLTDIPVFVWFPWVQNLFSMLLWKDHSYRQCVAKLIYSICNVYPQSIYLYLRFFFHELRDAMKSAENQKQNLDESTRQIFGELKPVADLSERLMQAFISQAQHLVQGTETTLKELYNRLKPETEEELQKALENILTTCYSYSVYEKPHPDLLTYLQRQITFNLNLFVPKQSQASRASRWNRTEMEFELITQPKDLESLSKALKKWISFLTRRIHVLPNILPLENLSKYLVEDQQYDIEIPGQYDEDREPLVDQHDRYQCCLPDMEVIHHNKSFSRRFTMRSQSGKHYRYLVQFSPNTSAQNRSEERTWALVRNLNWILEKHRIARRRNLRIHVPTIIPLTARLRIIQERPAYVPLEDPFHEHCCESKMNADTPILKFWEYVSKDKMSRQAAYERVANTLVPDTILRDYLYKLCPTWNEVFQIRKRMSTQLGLSGLLSHLIGVQYPELHKICISTNSGDIFNSAFRPYFKDGRIPRSSQVAFRFSRNLQNFITPFNVEGTMLSAMSVGSYAFSENKETLIAMLSTFIHDELIAWQTLRIRPSDRKYTQNKTYLNDNVGKNVDQILSLLQTLCPPDPVKSSKKILQDPPLNQQTHMLLIEQCTLPARVAALNPAAHPWF